MSFSYSSKNSVATEVSAFADGELQADINPKRLAGSGEPTVFIHSVIPLRFDPSISLWERRGR